MKTIVVIFKLVIGLILFLNQQAMGNEIIQSGDQIRLRIIGVLDKTYDVSPEGQIDFELWGKVKIAGLSDTAAMTAIKTHLSQFIRFDNNGVFLSIKKKLVEKHDDYVSVFGEVRAPGSFPYQEKLKVMDYIVLSGGTTRFALTDNIKVICVGAGKMQTNDFNMQLFSGGKPTQIPDIYPGCMIYIPEKPAEEASWLRNRPDQVIHIVGQVTKPGRYEFSEDFSLMDLLSHAGGVTIQAESEKVSIITNGKMNSFDLENYLKRGGELPKLHTGDVIYIPERQKTYSANWTKVPSNNAIYLVGAFLLPGRYDFADSLKLMDYIAQAGGPAEKADIKRVTIIRDKKQYMVFDFYAFQKGQILSMPDLQAEDVIYIPYGESWVKQVPQTIINIMGEVKNPGRFEVEPENMNIIDLLAAANGPTGNADLKQIRIMHRSQISSLPNQKPTMDVSVFDFEQFQKTGDLGMLPTLELGDTIMVPTLEKSFWEEFKTIGGTLGIVVLTIALL
ncbi:MAG: SLBB domain-containing protein [SAR324 cluster bacterium]|nr:SLBB domain-containing protein [SAR324 cluster bacterium]